MVVSLEYTVHQPLCDAWWLSWRAGALLATTFHAAPAPHPQAVRLQAPQLCDELSAKKLSAQQQSLRSAPLKDCGRYQ